MHERLALGVGDLFEQDDEGLDARGGEPGGLGVPAVGRERRAHRLGGVRGERGEPHAPAGSGGGLPSTGPRAAGLSFAAAPSGGGGAGAADGALGGSRFPASTISTSSRSSVSRSSKAAASRSSLSPCCGRVPRARSEAFP